MVGKKCTVIPDGALADGVATLDSCVRHLSWLFIGLIFYIADLQNISEKFRLLLNIYCEKSYIS